MVTAPGEAHFARVARPGPREMRTWLEGCDGLKTIRSRHTCAHRVDELMSIYAELTAVPSSSKRSPAATDLLHVFTPRARVPNLANNHSSDEARPCEQL